MAASLLVPLLSSQCANSVAAHPSPHTRPALKASVKELDERLALLEQAPSKSGLDKKELARRRALVRELQVWFTEVSRKGPKAKITRVRRL